MRLLFFISIFLVPLQHEYVFKNIQAPDNAGSNYPIQFAARIYCLFLGTYDLPAGELELFSTGTDFLALHGNAGRRTGV